MAKASVDEYEPQQLINEFQQIVETIYTHWSPQQKSLTDLSPSHGLLGADPAEIARLSVLLPWGSFLQTNGLQLGNAYNPMKRSIPDNIPDKGVTRLNSYIPLNGLQIIESGCFEGTHSISLAFYGAKVYSFDARIENVVKSLVRAWCFGCETKIKFDLIDLNKIRSLIE